MGPASTRALAIALTVNTRILNFSIRDNGIGEDGAVALAEMLIENNYIQDLDVSENKIGKKGSDALFQMLLENTTVQKIGKRFILTTLYVSVSRVNNKVYGLFAKTIWSFIHSLKIETYRV